MRQIFLGEANIIVRAETIFGNHDPGGIVVPDGSPIDSDLVQNYRWDGDGITIRQSMPIVIDKTEIAADGSDTANISGIPVGTDVYINGEFYDTVNDGVGTIKSTIPKAFNLMFINPPYRDFTETVNAV